MRIVGKAWILQGIGNFQDIVFHDCGRAKSDIARRL